MEKYFKDLGLDHNKRYTIEEIKSAWKKLCIKHHPDKGGSQEEFLKVTHAYNMLTDPSYRDQNISKEQAFKSDLNLRMQVPISFEQAFFGCEFNINYNREEMDGTGAFVQKTHYDIETIRIQIPRKSCRGVQRKFDGKGISKGSNRGDVEMNILIQPHHKFNINNDHDVICVEKVPLDKMLKGGKMDVQTMFGIKTIRIKPGTRPGEEIKIRNIGFCDHIIICEPLFPSAVDLRNEAWRGLDINWTIKDEVDSEEEMFQKDFAKFKRGGTP